MFLSVKMAMWIFGKYQEKIL